MGSCGLTSRIPSLKELEAGGAAAVILKSIFEEEIAAEYGNVLQYLWDKYGSDDYAGGFIRYRIGTGPKHPPEMDLKDFVLGKFTPDEQTIFDQQLSNYIDGLDLLIKQGPDQAMNQLNRRTDQHDPDQTQVPRDLHP